MGVVDTAVERAEGEGQNLEDISREICKYKRVFVRM